MQNEKCKMQNQGAEGRGPGAGISSEQRAASIKKFVRADLQSGPHTQDGDLKSRDQEIPGLPFREGLQIPPEYEKPGSTPFTQHSTLNSQLITHNSQLATRNSLEAREWQ